MARIVLKDIETEKSFEVANTEAMIGRDPACAIVIEGPNAKVVSGRHGRIFFQDDAWWIEDTSRNGTILDDERLQQGQRHAIRVGQTIGLGESGPRLKVATLESRKLSETVVEPPDLDTPLATSDTGPRRGAPQGQAPMHPTSALPPPKEPRGQTRSIRYSEAMRAGLRVEEDTEPMSPSPDWLVHVVLRGQGNQRYDVRAQVVKIGRSPECDVQIPAEVGAAVSRSHAEILIYDGGVTLRDAGSRNGTYLNGKRIEKPNQVAKDDVIMLGNGGPTLNVEDLHIVKGDASEPPAGGPVGTEKTPSTAKPIPGKRPVEPPTAPMPPKKAEIERPTPSANAAARLARSFAGIGRTAFFKDVLEDFSQKSARRVRIVVWASVATTVVVAAALLAVTQWRVAQSEQLMTTERVHFEARADSIRRVASVEADRLRAAFDSARQSSAPRAVVDSLRDALADATRRTGVLEQALARARQSLDQQLAAADTSRRKAEEDMGRLRAEVTRAQSGDGSQSVLDSLRRAFRTAEDRANDVAMQVRAIRGSNLAQVAQLNQGAVGLVFFFTKDKERISAGSGFVITPSGYLITNRHVVTDADGQLAQPVYVTMADQRFTTNMQVQVVRVGGPDVDIAVVKIPNYRGPYVKKVDWGGVAAGQGEPAALIGFPFGVQLAFNDTSASAPVRTSMSAGIISKVAPDFIQFGGITVGGSSGSPVFNAAGEVVGVHRAGLEGGLAFAVPTTKVLRLLPDDAKNELGIR